MPTLQEMNRHIWGVWASPTPPHMPFSFLPVAVFSILLGSARSNRSTNHPPGACRGGLHYVKGTGSCSRTRQVDGVWGGRPPARASTNQARVELANGLRRIQPELLGKQTNVPLVVSHQLTAPAQPPQRFQEAQVRVVPQGVDLEGLA